MTHHSHYSDPESAGFFAANMMAIMLTAIILVGLLVALVVWQPWDTAGTNDGGGGGIDIDIGGGGGGTGEGAGSGSGDAGGTDDGDSGTSGE